VDYEALIFAFFVFMSLFL